MAAITEENFGRYLFLYKMLPALKAKALEAGTKINGISTIEYFKKLLSELLTGNNNYAGLLPQTIGIKR